ncbi:MAG: AAA family ATPase [Acidobacteria bacterium]|nr:AAA family ATPase [Acidobacteriota bacterium]
MLTRLYVDNFRCFENFEYLPAPKQLIFGANGTGKSSFVDAVLFLRQVVLMGGSLDEFHMQGQRTRWLNRARQTFELEAAFDKERYTYRLVLEPVGDPVRTKIGSETLHLNGQPIFSFEEGEVHLYNDRLEHIVTYPFDWHRSALATIAARKDNQLLTKFKTWLAGVVCFRINPFAILARADEEHLFPSVSLHNFAAWYRHLVQSDQRQINSLFDSLGRVLDGFEVLQLVHAGENVRLLTAEFRSSGGSTAYSLQELSEGQRCLICLYTVLHFVLAKGGTVLIDEPDNFIALREIQPWLTSATDAVEDHKAQLLLISHHPEIIDQWAPSEGVQFAREQGGPTRVKKFEPANQNSNLTPSELAARGWLD